MNANKKPLKNRRNTRITRASLIRAGEILFGTHGVDGVGIDEILKSANVARQSFYNHFVDKESLAKEILRITRDKYENEINVLNADIADPARRIARGMCYYARRVLDDLDHARFVSKMLTQDIAAVTNSNQGVMGDISSGLAEGRISVFTVEIGAIFIMGCTQTLMARAVLVGDLGMTVQFVTLALRGLGLPPLEAETIAAQAADEIIRQRINRSTP